MSNLTKREINILDLPDEILLKILEKLLVIDVFHSFLDVNQRINRLLFDSIYVRHLDLSTMTTIHFSFEDNSTLNSEILSRICKTVLPKIHHHVYKMTVDQNTMIPVLHAASYPNLHSLSLIHIQEEILHEYLTSDLILRNLMEQIQHLTIDVKERFPSLSIISVKSLGIISSLCKKLITCNFGDVYLPHKCVIAACQLSYEDSILLNLVQLQINLEWMPDCIYFLDGRFESLSSLILCVSNIDRTIDWQKAKQLSKLKCFSLTAPKRTAWYDATIVPLLSQMINLEELKLYLRVVRYNSTYIHGSEFSRQFLVSMRQLRKFTFDIRTEVRNTDVSIKLPTTKDMPRRYLGKGYQKAAFRIDSKRCQSHVYSFPHGFEYFYGLDNTFRRGSFPEVRHLTMNDEIPFEHELFRRISRDFPFLKYLTLNNNSAMKGTKYSSTSISFPSLTYLDLLFAHGDYGKQFLLKTNAYLPSLSSLRIHYGPMRKITKNFTKDVRKFNFDHLKSLCILGIDCPKDFRGYFPSL